MGEFSRIQSDSIEPERADAARDYERHTNILEYNAALPQQRRTFFGYRGDDHRGLLVFPVALLVYLTMYWHMSKPFATGPFSTEHFRRHQDQQRLDWYAGENVAWGPCEHCEHIEGHILECSNVDVPMDQFDAVNSGDKLFNIPLIRLRGNDNAQNLLLNPGGPGDSGVEFLVEHGKPLQSVVGDGFHLVSFDPRGVGGSQPAASCYPGQYPPPPPAVHAENFVSDSTEFLS